MYYAFLKYYKFQAYIDIHEIDKYDDSINAPSNLKWY